jgi:uncharacterized membrane protein (Fun14 family)
MSDPLVLGGLALQFLLGLALGYVSAKALKYILAFMGLLALAAAVNSYTFGSSMERMMEEYYQQAVEVVPHVKRMLASVGILTIGPTTLGFILGAAIGLIKK